MDAIAEIEQRFIRLWDRNVNGATEAFEVYTHLVQRYSEPHRHYHTLTHIRHCLEAFDQVRGLAADPDGLEMALWFHDAIFFPGAKSNERRSAQLFYRWSDGCQDPGFRQRVCSLIRMTTHRQIPGRLDEGLIVDIDLSSFGLRWEQCAWDERQIRAEFSQMADDLYYPSSLQFLRTLQERPTLFFTDYFRQRYESIARANLHRLIASVCARGYDLL